MKASNSKAALKEASAPLDEPIFGRKITQSSP